MYDDDGDLFLPDLRDVPPVLYFGWSRHFRRRKYVMRTSMFPNSHDDSEAGKLQRKDESKMYTEERKGHVV